jgi:D-alanyl-D-alanine carboxypeptidase
MVYEKQLQKIDQILQKIASKNTAADTQVRIYSGKLGIDYRYASEGLRPFHGASIGKVFVVVLLLQMVHEQRLSLDQPIHELLDAKDLQGLFVVGGKDYSDEVTIRQLAMHISGVNDYFESKSSSDSSFVDQIISQPDHVWTPDELVDFTRKYQKAVARPGEMFFYSDTGYILLGKIVEKACGMSYGEILSKYIFEPLGMEDSYLYSYSSAATKTMAPLFVSGVDVSKMRSLSCDWSGGGVVTTTDDLLRFQTAVHQGKLGDLLSEQAGFPNKFRGGMHYGFGMMELHFNEFFFLLRGMPNMKGHIGITSTHMFYDDVNDVHYIMNFGSDKRMVESFRTLIKIVQILKMKCS